MSREKTLFIVGIIVMTLPQLGFSNLTEKIIFLALGILIVLVSYTLYFDKVKKVHPVSKKSSAARTPAQPKETLPKEEMTGFTYINPPTQKALDGQEKTNDFS